MFKSLTHLDCTQPPSPSVSDVRTLAGALPNLRILAFKSVSFLSTWFICFAQLLEAKKFPLLKELVTGRTPSGHVFDRLVNARSELELVEDNSDAVADEDDSEEDP